MFNSNLSGNLMQALEENKQLLGLLSVAIGKLGGSLKIDQEDLERMKYSNLNLYSYIDEKDGGRIYKVK